MERKIRYSILFILGFCFCCHHSINAQVIYNNDSVTAQHPPPGGASFTLSNFQAASGTNRLLVVYLGIVSGTVNSATSVKYNGQDLTLAVTISSSLTLWSQEIWYLELGTGENITADVVVTYPDIVLVTHMAVASFKHVHQTTPVGNTIVGEGQADASTLSLNGDTNDLIIDAIFKTTVGNLTPSQSIVYTLSTSLGGSYLNAAQGFNNMHWSFLGVITFIHVAAEINHDGVTLPVEMTYFKGENKGHKNHLTWQTASESNNEGFEIERSPNGEQWETIGFRDGQGTSYEVQDYSYIDEYPLDGQNYYRLKQVDYDGRYEFSEVVSVVGTPKSQGVRIYPNPVSEGEVFIQTGSQETYVSILNNMGKKIRSIYFPTGVGTLEVGDLPEGIYFLNIQTEGEKYIEKIIKQ